MFGLGFQEILVIALIVLLFFGGKKIPELMRGLGKGVKSFKEGMNEVTDLKEEVEKDEKKDAGYTHNDVLGSSRRTAWGDSQSVGGNSHWSISCLLLKGRTLCHRTGTTLQRFHHLPTIGRRTILCSSDEHRTYRTVHGSP